MTTWLRRAAWWAMDYAYVVRWQLVAVTRWRAVGELDPPASAGSPPNPTVVLIPGVFESWQFMRPLANRLHRCGCPVHLVPALGFNTGPIPDMARVVAADLVRHDLTGVVLVAHSKGGLIGRYAMVHLDPDHRIRALVAVNTPFAGSRYARWIPLPAVQAFAPTDPTLAALSADDAVNARITSVSSRFDPHIPGGSSLAGAADVQLRTPGHFRALGDPELVPVILDALARADRG
ncbi:esterase/lipase family protein [Pengzhenrongella frigida]|uniref:AB hydrolase-1 domain-containing protein n=1 Tax=Pengzhenrongella frigida TaxID=1259133 RepID=A0A4Q5MZT6_9MICO|nr:alpha/beta fold hydrolase [Cellulomonas sp. HLT2-17]RYV51298.1 hypothetical protein EUA98_09095 [Cellulomonas sp. HLT2-17]